MTQFDSRQAPPLEGGDPDAPPSEEEIRESQRLRDALEDASKESADADLLRAVKHAAEPKAIAKADLDEAVQRGIARGERNIRSGGVVIRVAFGASFVVAAAAAVVFFLGRGPVQPPDLVHARSTQPLFTERFESRGGESARIDRIAVARAADLRENHFARWGVGEKRGRR
ncbi:MAG TPA: hypothetical protein VH054_05605 [Polyangiaceae bacterium]|jgi:hypothetical protein|nr:hypothetical protein [Polyangiaceae bacterium]